MFKQRMIGVLSAVLQPLFLFLLFLVADGTSDLYDSQRRHKESDDTYTRLIPFTEVPLDCESTQNGYGIVDGSLEKCEVYTREDKELHDHEDGSYEKYKCKRLRVHGKLNSNSVCECDHNWKGPICNEYIGCPDGYSLFNGVCTPNVCQHDGQLAIGTRHIECICRAPWDGRWCERLACWRMAPKEFERRWRNNIDRCKCGDGYDGENCDRILFCKNGELVGGRCECTTGWKGEICDRKCIPDQTCSASSAYASFFITLIIMSVGVVGLAFCDFSSLVV